MRQRKLLIQHMRQNITHREVQLQPGIQAHQQQQHLIQVKVQIIRPRQLGIQRNQQQQLGAHQQVLKLHMGHPGLQIIRLQHIIIQVNQQLQHLKHITIQQYKQSTRQVEIQLLHGRLIGILYIEENIFRPVEIQVQLR